LNLLERLAYWVEVSRRGLSTDKIMTAGGPSVSPEAQIEIRRIEVRSQAGGSAYQGTIRAQITGLSTLPVGKKSPLRVDMEADFPSLQIQGLRLKALVDHTFPTPKEELSLVVDSFPIYHWPLENSNSLKVSLVSANAGLDFQMQMQNEQMDAHWKIKATDASFETSSQSAALESTLREILEPLHSRLELSGQSVGTLNNIQVSNESDFGKLLASRLGEKYNSALRGASEATRDRLTARFIPALHKLQRRNESAALQALNRVATTMKTLELKTE
jgi:hypothetical protein